jgi:hypothetical protein
MSTRFNNTHIVVQNILQYMYKMIFFSLVLSFTEKYFLRILNNNNTYRHFYIHIIRFLKVSRYATLQFLRPTEWSPHSPDLISFNLTIFGTNLNGQCTKAREKRFCPRIA